MNDPISLPPLRGHVTLDPAGIELFAAILHCVFAHRVNPIQGEWSPRHHADAAEYLRAHARGCELDRIDTTNDTAAYCAALKGRMVVFRVRRGVPLDRCLEIAASSGVYVTTDISNIVVRADGDRGLS